jgi:NSS family neurotransmitter:Na+ symporter
VPEPIEVDVAKRGGDSIDREVFGTRAGFVLAAVGSAVGLGNMWRFPYVASEGGGAAFVVLYIALTLIVGIPIMLAEFAAGRRGRLSPIGAIRKAGGPAWLPMGFFFVLTGLLILSYYSVIAGWTVRYAIEAILSGFPADPGAHFEAVSAGMPAIVYHMTFMLVTISIVMVGVEKGIEKASLVLMPALFMILIGLAFWAATLDGGGAGYAFYLRPSMEDLLNLDVFSDAAGQAFFSLSLGMGAMLTFSSYLSKHENLNREAAVISFADFGVAFIAGLVVFPVIAALGLQDQVGESAVGALFISLPGAFASMGSAGRVVGTLFFLALVVGALTSAISLLEVVVSSMIDEFKLQRKTAALSVGIVIALIGIFPALNGELLEAMDAVAGGFFLVLGALGMAILVGWRMEDPAAELLDGASPAFARVVPLVLFFLRWIAPLILLLVIWNKAGSAWETIQALSAGS